ncbi:MAG: hypothetical protein ACRYGK_04700, partial [Janthinobacterium lividum]
MTTIFMIGLRLSIAVNIAGARAPMCQSHVNDKTPVACRKLPDAADVLVHGIPSLESVCSVMPTVANDCACSMTQKSCLRNQAEITIGRAAHARSLPT